MSRKPPTLGTHRQPSAPTPSQGLSHLTFVVDDLDRMETILVRVLGAVRIYDSGVRPYSLSAERFYLIGRGSRAVWVAAMKRPGPKGAERTPGSYDHVAFQVDRSALPALRQVIAELGLEERKARARVDGEGESIYFLDDDNHLFELHAGTLETRLERYCAQPAPLVRQSAN